jgi:hypothetical protein
MPGARVPVWNPEPTSTILFALCVNPTNGRQSSCVGLLFLRCSLVRKPVCRPMQKFICLWQLARVHCQKNVRDFPVPIRDVTYQGQGEFRWWHPGWGREITNLFLQCGWGHCLRILYKITRKFKWNFCKLVSRTFLEHDQDVLAPRLLVKKFPS